MRAWRGGPVLGVSNVARPFSGALMAYDVGFARRDEVLAGIVVLSLSVAYALTGAVGFVVSDLFGPLPGGSSIADELLHPALGVLGIMTVEARRGDYRKRGAP